MESQKLAQMDFDEFVENALEAESVASTDSPQENLKIEPNSKAKRHKQVLSNLSKDDPEFYKFLLENDKELLDFDVSDEDSDNEEATSNSDSGDGQLEPVSDTDSDKSIENSVPLESIDSDEKVDSDFDDDDERDVKNIVTKKQVIFMAKALKTKNSNSTFKHATDLFHTAVYQVAGEKIESSQKLAFEKVTTFNELVLCCLECVPLFLQRQLVSSNDVIIIRGKKCKKNWSKIRENVKLYLSDILFTLDKLVESSLLCKILYSIKPLICLFLEFRGLRKKYMKTLIKLWSKDERSVQLQSFLCMKGSILFANYSLFNYLLKRSYLSFVQSSKFSSEVNKEYIAFLIDSLVEIYSVDLSRGYQLAFVYIRQLAIHLRNALTSKTDETTQFVYNWQFIHSIEFWSKVLSAEGAADTHLKQLIFPLVQVTLGAISLSPIVKFYPLRFRCIKSLNYISLHTNTYIPIANYMLETLDYVRSVSKYTHLPPKPPNFAYTLKVSKQFMKTKHFIDYAVETAFELLLEHLSSFEHSIAFPEMSFPVLRELKKFAKATNNSKHRREIKSLIEKIEIQSKFIEDLRSTVDFAPKDTDKVREWERTSAIKHSNLSNYLNLWRKSVIKINENLVQNHLELDEPKNDVEKKILKSRKRKRQTQIEPTTSSNSDSDIDDKVIELNLDNWDD
ncbi:Nucleolar complex protein 2-like [Oopsacas minuta]|uniref:Nucleolar complex protein 2-like n=1 Tax=Oopsacas minuta TaxID=111878 RepID=A0AAV7KG47_9METZ|nr:Nucleolar complex protein 2-like [Oopsacas minuta]